MIYPKRLYKLEQSIYELYWVPDPVEPTVIPPGGAGGGGSFRGGTPPTKGGGGGGGDGDYDYLDDLIDELDTAGASSKDITGKTLVNDRDDGGSVVV